VNTTLNKPIAVYKRLLIVDDHQPLARMLSWAFENLGYHMITAADCRAARRMARLSHPSHALIDYRLPDGNGLILARDCRRSCPTCKSY
jgi:DNA-binding response OmpR family regulator